MRNRFTAVLGMLTLATSIVACAQTDAGVTTKVKAKFAADDTVKAYQINVDTRDHVVTLTGEVDSAIAKDRAVALTRETEGVRDVVNDLRVGAPAASTSGISDKAEELGHETADKAKEIGHDAADVARDAGEAITDAAITTSVKSQMLANTKVSGLKIDVDTKDHMVTLSGMVPTAAEKAEAQRIAKETSGVKGVHNNLKIGKS